jgi:CRP-like cAMP-binding protein
VFDRIHAAVAAAHDAVVSQAAAQPGLKGMGCTLDLAVLLGEHAFVAHVGDSRVYLARSATTIQLTHDHTLAGALVAKGIATPTRPPAGGHALTNAIGRKGTIKVDESFVELTYGDRLVLCSDGIYGELKDENLIGRFARQGSTDEGTVALVNAALERGGHDNATALIVEVGLRRVSRGAPDGGLSARDASYARHCPLINGLSEDHSSRALSAAVEVQVQADADLPRYNAADRVAYIVLEGTVTTPQGWSLGPSGLVYAESLAGGGRGNSICKARTTVRALRIRSDDFREVCASEPALGSVLYERLARTIAQVLA